MIHNDPINDVHSPLKYVPTRRRWALRFNKPVARPERADKTLVRYIRDDRRQPVGVLVATSEGIGWSVAAPRDRFDRQLGVHIATERIVTGTNARVPDFAFAAMGHFIADSERYFFSQPTT